LNIPTRTLRSERLLGNSVLARVMIPCPNPQKTLFLLVKMDMYIFYMSISIPLQEKHDETSKNSEDYTTTIADCPSFAYYARDGSGH
jgi:hypothetical protein